MDQIQFVIDIEEGIEEQDLDSVDKFNLYRIIQELFNNSLKHAGASEFSISLRRCGEGIELIAMDNGVGFEMAKIQKGLGIENIQYRMNMAGIQGAFNSVLGKGPSVKMMLKSV